MADANSVTPALATLGPNGWAVNNPTTGPYGGAGNFNAAEYYALKGVVSGAWNIAPTSDSATTQTAKRTTLRPRLRLSAGIQAAHSAAVVAAGGTTPTAAQYDAIRPALETFLRGSAWPKMKVVWFPIGADGDLNAMRVCLKEVSGTLALTYSKTGTDVTYTAAGGVVFTAAQGQKLVTTYQPSGSYTNITNVANTSWGFGVFAIAYGTNATGCYAGMDANSLAYCGLESGANNAQIYGTQVWQRANNGMVAVQYDGGTVQSLFGAWLRASTAVAAGSLPAGAMAINGTGGSNYQTWTAGGFYVADGLTGAELKQVRDFFIEASLALGRPVYQAAGTATFFGDSIERGATGSGVTTVNCWAQLVANRYGMTRNSRGQDGWSMSANASAAAIFASLTNTGAVANFGLRQQGAMNVFAFGINDNTSITAALNGSLPQFLADYAAVIGNLIASGMRPEAMVLLPPYYTPPGKGVDDNLSQQMAAGIKAIATQYGLAYADVLNDPRMRAVPAGTGWPTDVHPTQAVHQIIAQIVCEAIAAAQDSTAIAAL